MFAPGAGRFIGPAAGIALLGAGALAFGVGPWGLDAGLLVAGILLVGFFGVFFRDPERSPATGIASPADGRVRAVERIGDRWRISIFMNVTNVHVNRAPLDARVAAIEGRGAAYHPAYRADADDNVQRSYALETELGPVEVVQVTGILARRLVSFVQPGTGLAKGERFGMIVLGSRVDLWLPGGRTRPTVAVGQRVRAGSSTVAEALP